jgi:GNAT superfamily N-acetyltransferase
MQIRQATQGDAESLRGLIESVEGFASLKALPEGARQRRVAHHLSLALADASHQVFVAIDDDSSLLGYVAIHYLPYLILTGPEGYVSELFIQEQARGKGVGTQLLARVQAEAQGRGCSRLALLNMQDRESYVRGFYNKNGWEERADARNFVLPLPKTASYS